MDYNGMRLMFSNGNEMKDPNVSLTLEVKTEAFCSTPKLYEPPKIVPPPIWNAFPVKKKKKAAKKKKAKKAKLEPQCEVQIPEPPPQVQFLTASKDHGNNQSNLVPLHFNQFEAVENLNNNFEAQNCPPSSSLNESAPIFKVEVAPENYPQMKMNAELKGRLSRAIVRSFKSLPNGLYPTFNGVHLDEGGCIISCAGETTKNWLLNILPVLEWDGPRLIAGEEGEIIRTFIVRCEPPLDMSDFSSKEVLRLLKHQNPSLRRGFWAYFTSKKENNKVQYFWRVGEEVYKAILSQHNQAYLGLHRINLTFIVGKKLENLCANVPERGQVSPRLPGLMNCLPFAPGLSGGLLFP